MVQFEDRTSLLLTVENFVLKNEKLKKCANFFDQMMCLNFLIRKSVLFEYKIYCELLIVKKNAFKQNHK